MLPKKRMTAAEAAVLDAQLPAGLTDEMRDVMRDIMTGQCTEAQIGAFMMGMRMKSESIDEIVGAVSCTSKPSQCPTRCM